MNNYTTPSQADTERAIDMVRSHELNSNDVTVPISSVFEGDPDAGKYDREDHRQVTYIEGEGFVYKD